MKRWLVIGGPDRNGIRGWPDFIETFATFGGADAQATARGEGKWAYVIDLARLEIVNDASQVSWAPDWLPDE